jgi:amino acid permease
MDATDTKEKTSPTVSSNKIDNINHVGYERSTVVAGSGNLKRQLKPRHLAMISIGKSFAWSRLSLLNSLTGGVIGTGLFLGTASSLKNGVPAGLLLGYSVRLLF